MATPSESAGVGLVAAVGAIGDRLEGLDDLVEVALIRAEAFATSAPVALLRRWLSWAEGPGMGPSGQPFELAEETRRLLGRPSQDPTTEAPVAIDSHGADPMVALLRASASVRDGRWIKGAPSHVLAELLTELEADGWRLSRDESTELGDRAVEVLDGLIGVLRSRVPLVWNGEVLVAVGGTPDPLMVLVDDDFAVLEMLAEVRAAQSEAGSNAQRGPEPDGSPQTQALAVSPVPQETGPAVEAVRAAMDEFKAEAEELLSIPENGSWPGSIDDVYAAIDALAMPAWEAGPGTEGESEDAINRLLTASESRRFTIQWMPDPLRYEAIRVDDGVFEAVVFIESDGHLRVLTEDEPIRQRIAAGKAPSSSGDTDSGTGAD